MNWRERRDMPYIIGAALIVIILVIWVSIAKAHEWYDSDCCSGKDCDPVPDGTVVETGQGVVVKGFETIQEGDTRLRWSKDERDHICVAKAPYYYSQGVQQKLRCVYRKRKFM